MTLAKAELLHFEIEAKPSLFTVQAFASGIANVVAHSPKFAIRDFTGDIRFVSESMENASMSLCINVSSLEIMDEVRKSERDEIERVMFDEVLERKKYPTIEFNSRDVSASKTSAFTYRLNIAGDLNIHGTARRTSIEAQIVAGEESLKAQGAFSISQADFGLKLVSVAGGTLKLKDEIRCSYFVVARKKIQ